MSDCARQGDCLIHLCEMADASVDLIATDPPYASGTTRRGTDGQVYDDRMPRDEFIDYMRPRAQEMRRVLRADGALYWQTDPNVSPWVRIMLNEVFGDEAFNAEIVWRRTHGYKESTNWGKVCDYILFYGDPRIDRDAVRVPVSAATLDIYTHEDEHGRYGVQRSLLVSGGTSPTAASAQEWRGIKPGADQHWVVPRRMPAWFRKPPGFDSWPTVDRLDELDRQGMVHWPDKPGGIPRCKSYLSEMVGMVPSTIWTDCPRVARVARENTGYPTQKPLALYERIVLASSKPGDLVLDPFCGSGTTLVAATRHGRRALGFDESDKAVGIANARVRDEAADQLL